MKLQTVSIFVDDQQRALDFYTSTLGFTVTADVPLGEHRWLTVRLGDSAAATEVSLEPKAHPAAVAFADALLEDGIPYCVLGVDDIEREHARLAAAGVVFTQPPTDVGPVIVAVFDDTCGNLLQLAQVKDGAAS
ncbi:VOC family protein [Nocardioides sp. R-C-SC26]|uniref:VOC family protein n=1 Tax=Nocardioides sp. R-C-SC26 TaxID=2870414 RepID=UPI001E36B7FA|nr:VOC family protein [Nocardioides sp. R-C-SC26]